MADAENLIRTAAPSDVAFRDEFEKASLGYEYVAAYALRKIENFLDDAEKTIGQPVDVQVEHIMPKTPTPFWQLRVPDDLAYEEAVKRWGNLTLLLGRANASISNGDWTAKRQGIDGHHGYNLSKVVMTQDLIDLPEWTYNSIDVRARWLALVATRVW